MNQKNTVVHVIWHSNGIESPNVHPNVQELMVKFRVCDCYSVVKRTDKQDDQN